MLPMTVPSTSELNLTPSVSESSELFAESATSDKLEEILYQMASKNISPMKIVGLLETSPYRFSAADKKLCCTMAQTAWFCPEDHISCSRMDGQHRVRSGHVMNPYEDVDAFDVLATYLPILVLPKVSTSIAHLSDAIQVLAIMMFASDRWILRWWRTVPSDFINDTFRSAMAAGILRQLHNCAEYVDFRRLTSEQIKMRVDLLCVIDRHAPYCAHGCGCIILYDIQAMMIKEDFVRPSAAFLCRDAMPGYQKLGGTVCLEHTHPLIMVATREIPAGCTPITVCWENPMNASDEDLKSWHHPALIWPVRTMKTPRAEAIVTAFDRIEKMINGSPQRIKFMKYDNAQGHELADKVRAGIRNFRKRAIEFGDFEQQSPNPSEDWPMVLDVPSYRLLRLFGTMLWVLPLSSSLFKECADIYKKYYIANIHTMEWPNLVFDMVAACAFLREQRPCPETEDLFQAALDEFEILEEVHETHMEMCERIATYAPFSSFYSTAFKVTRMSGQTEVFVHEGDDTVNPAILNKLFDH